MSRIRFGQPLVALLSMTVTSRFAGLIQTRDSYSFLG